MAVSKAIWSKTLFKMTTYVLYIMVYMYVPDFRIDYINHFKLVGCKNVPPLGAMSKLLLAPFSRFACVARRVAGIMAFIFNWIFMLASCGMLWQQLAV